MEHWFWVEHFLRLVTAFGRRPAHTDQVVDGQIKWPSHTLSHCASFQTQIDQKPHAGPMKLFFDAKNHKPPTSSREIRGLCLHNLAVKESAILVFLEVHRCLISSIKTL